jgi:hypothetical protein
MQSIFNKEAIDEFADICKKEMANGHIHSVVPKEGKSFIVFDILDINKVNAFLYSLRTEENVEDILGFHVTAIGNGDPTEDIEDLKNKLKELIGG